MEKHDTEGKANDHFCCNNGRELLSDWRYSVC